MPAHSPRRPGAARPLRRFGEAAVHDPSTLKNLPSRAQSSNAAFAKRPTRQFRECIEDLFFRDADASVVVPSRDQRRYTTRIVDADGNPLTDLYGTDLGDGIILGTGNPADGNPLDTPVEDLSLGVEFTVRRVAGSNRWVVIRVNAADAENAP